MARIGPFSAHYVDLRSGNDWLRIRSGEVKPIYFDARQRVWVCVLPYLAWPAYLWFKASSQVFWVRVWWSRTFGDGSVY